METDGVIKFMPVNKNIDTSVSASYIYVSGSTSDLYFSQNSNGYNNVTRLRWLEGNLYTGLLHGGLITTASSTVYRVSSGSGIIVDLNASLNNDPYPVIQFLQWGNLSASIAPLTASYQQAFVSIASTGNIYQQGTPYASGQYDTVINVGVVLFQNGSTINGVKTQPSLAYGFEQQQNIFNRAFGPLKLSGYTLAASGSSTGSLIVASGTAYSPGANYPIDPNNPSYATDNGTNVSKIFRYRQSGSTWVYDTNAGLGYGAIDPTRYSNNGVLTAVPGGGSNREFSIQRVFYFPNSVAKAIVVYYGNATYASLTDATANIAFEQFVEAPNTAANAIYLGAIIVRNNANFTVTDSYAIQAGGLFRSVGGSGGGGSIVTQTLSGLSDVSISGPIDGEILIYNGTSQKWENEPNTAVSSSYAVTASYVNTLNQNVILSGSLTARQTGFNASGIFTGDTIGSIALTTTASNGFSLFTLGGAFQIYDNTNAATRFTLSSGGSIAVNAITSSGIISIGRSTTSQAVIQRAQTPAGSYSFILASGTGIVDTFPYTMTDSHGATIDMRAGDPTSDQYGGGIIFSANGHTSPLGDGNAIVFKTRSGVNTYSERMRIASNGSVTCNSITASLQGTASYATTAKSTSGQYLCQGKLSGNQSIPNDADTVIQFVDDIDPNNWYDAGTYRFTPTIAGYYSISVGAWLATANATTNQFNLQGRKNGSQFVFVQCPLPNDVGQSLTFTRMIYMNGSSDYLDFTVYQGAGTNIDINGGTGTWFTAHLIST
jgi:hypothetical protein